MRGTILVGAVTAMLVASLSTLIAAQAPGPTVTVATVEWIEQFDPGVLASGPGLNYKGRCSTASSAPDRPARSAR